MKNSLFIILDGWGIAPAWGGNAIIAAKTPVMDYLWETCPRTMLVASGEQVGLPPRSNGNSETGHLNLGAGKIVRQDISLISALIDSGEFYKNPGLIKAIRHVKKNKSSLHLMGLLGTGGVHSHLDHLFALLDLLSATKTKEVYLHLFTDGRDSEPQSALEFLEKLRAKMSATKTGTIASITGRFYAMDRDSRWERIQAAYDVIVKGKGEKAVSAEEAVGKFYTRNITDEFIPPTIIVDKKDKTKHIVKDNDAVIFFNVRPDRARQLTRAFVGDDFKEFRRGKKLANLCFVTFVPYEENLSVITVVQPDKSVNTISKVIADNKLRQIHIAETEKYAHVTYYFGGGHEKKLPKEEWNFIPSPHVRTYDLQPEMSAEPVTNLILNKIKRKHHDFMVINFANTDMVGHTGNFSATVKAAEYVDKCLGSILKEIKKQDGLAVVTADHGNAEQMINPLNGQPDTEHTANPIPFIIYVPNDKIRINKRLPEGGMLANAAPTFLNLIGQKPSKEMVERSLIK